VVTSLGVPEIEAGWALFLDLDGTLLDIAPTPDAVQVPPGLVPTLAAVAQRLHGAMAIVTGRPRETVDGLLAPLAPAGGFGHGAVLRDAAGRIGGAEAMPAPPQDWADRLHASIAAWPGVILERKPHGLALHFRAVPERQQAARAALEALLAGHGEDFVLLPAHMAYEIRPRAASKGRAVEALMRTDPFSGRMPVFVGDDVTDEDGMEAARRMGGFGLHVGRDFRHGPEEVRAWLARAAARLPQGGQHAHA
jgi:trehalose 6-phosphate phosphatase